MSSMRSQLISHLKYIVDSVRSQLVIDLTSLLLVRTGPGYICLDAMLDVSTKVGDNQQATNLVKCTKCKVIHLHPDRSSPVVFILAE